MWTLRKSKSMLVAIIGTMCVCGVAKAGDGTATTQPTYKTVVIRKNGDVDATTVNGGQLIITGPNSSTIGGNQITFRYQPQMVKAAFLGLETGTADATLRAQLKLPEGVGLTVRHVYDQSPAQAAGVQEHDVLYKLNDQLLINPEQYAVLVRTFKPGDEVELTVIREAQPLKLKAKLIEKEVDALVGVCRTTSCSTWSTPMAIS